MVNIITDVDRSTNNFPKQCRNCKIWIADIETVDTEESLNQISNIEVAASFLEKYSKAKLQGIKEELGVTASFGLNILI